jgi:hypothetical protein
MEENAKLIFVLTPEYENITYFQVKQKYVQKL